MKRRDFITATVGAGLLPAAAAADDAARRAGAAPPEGATPGVQDAPDNRAAKYSDRIVPITPEERAQRREKARRLMAATGIDLLLLEGGHTLRYFTGVRWGRSERAFLMAFPAKGEPWFIAPKFEESRAAEQVGSARLLTWEEDHSPWDLLRSSAAERGVATGVIGLEESVRFLVTDGTRNALPSATIVDGTPVTAGCRAVKTDAEIALMQVANDITADAFRDAAAELRPGMTEREFGRVVSKSFSAYGVGGGALVLFGESAAHPHGLEKEATLREGDIVLIDGGCTVSEYVSDVTRTTVLGKPTPRMESVFRVVLEAQHAALRAARPGVPANDIDAAARAVVEAAGYGPGYRYFTHRLGHGIGMEGHEWYYLVKGSARPETPGDVHSNEPGIYLPGEFGVRIEDEMVITGDGARLMLPSPTSLTSMFG